MSFIVSLIGLVFVGAAAAEPLLEGRVRLESGEPVADAQVRIFDLSDLRQGAIARAMTDGTGYFALPLATLGGRALPAQFALGPNYPNPFNPSTIIPYQLAASSAVRLEVFNLLGQHLATLVDGERAVGFHTATWHATDGAGRAVGAGVYIYRMTVGVESQTGRMVLVDGQAGLAASVMPGVSGVGGLDGEGAHVYGLVVSGDGLVPYVDSSFRVEAGMEPVELVVSSGPYSAGKVADDACAFCGLLGASNDQQQEEEDETTEEAAETDSTSSERGGPDLIVQSPSASAVRLTPGQTFTLQVTVHNQGDEQAAATTLHYYRSNNATITPTDTQVGTDAVDALDASATSAESIALTASVGVERYYGACVASVRGESNTDNNCSSAVRITGSGQVATEEEEETPDVFLDPQPTNGGTPTVERSSSGSPGQATLRAHPNPGYDFQRWTSSGKTLSRDATFVMDVTGKHEVEAHYSVNQDRGRWNVGQTYSYYHFPRGAYDRLAWTFAWVADPTESLREEGLLHYYAYQFYLVNATAKVGKGYAGFQSKGMLNGEHGKVVNYSIWGSNGGKTDGVMAFNDWESNGYQIMYPFEWVQGRGYRFELRPGPSGQDDRGKWWGLWVTDEETEAVTFIGEQRMPARINGREAVLWLPSTLVFGEDLHWWFAADGEYICSDFQPSSLVVRDVTAGDKAVKPSRVDFKVNSGEGYTWENGHKTTNCHVTMFTNEQGDVQHNLGFWPEPPKNVLD